MGISRKTGYKWLGRYRCEGAAGLVERSHAPLRHGSSASDRSGSWPASRGRMAVMSGFIAPSSKRPPRHRPAACRRSNNASTSSARSTTTSDRTWHWDNGHRRHLPTLAAALSGAARGSELRWRCRGPPGAQQRPDQMGRRADLCRRGADRRTGWRGRDQRGRLAGVLCRCRARIHPSAAPSAQPASAARCQQTCGFDGDRSRDPTTPQAHQPQHPSP